MGLLMRLLIIIKKLDTISPGQIKAPQSDNKGSVDQADACLSSDSVKTSLSGLNETSEYNNTESEKDDINASLSSDSESISSSDSSDLTADSSSSSELTEDDESVDDDKSNQCRKLSTSEKVKSTAIEPATKSTKNDCKIIADKKDLPSDLRKNHNY